MQGIGNFPFHAKLGMFASHIRNIFLFQEEASKTKTIHPVFSSEKRLGVWIATASVINIQYILRL